MNQLSAQRAIKAALAGNWDEAIEFNLQILKNEPENIEALNRLARAYLAIGQTKNAQKTWNKVLRSDHYNPIALGQLEKLKSQTRMTPGGKQVAPSAQTFLDEPGKTKTTPLVRLANNKILACLQVGQAVKLLAKTRCVAVTNLENEYIGSLPDDLSIHLSKLIKAGNKYEALIRRAEKNHLSIFIKEIKRVKRNQHTPSFPSNKFSFPLEIDSATPLNDIPIDVAPTGEEESYQ